MRITFHGGAGTVTGSRFLVEHGSTRVLVDCGLFQGLKQLRLRNWDAPPIAPDRLDAIVLTHAHLDHSGYLPVMVRHGYKGPVWVTPPTAALLGILLPDSGRIQEEDARYAQRHGYSKHKTPRALYTEGDANTALRALRQVGFGETLTIGELEVSMQPAGHILGAASVLVRGGGTSVVFSGDLGRDHDLLMQPPQPRPAADWVVMESTYGDRDHPELDPIDAVQEVWERTRARGGVLLIPAFAVGRAQALLRTMHVIFTRRPDLRGPVFMDSPMASSVTSLYERFSEYHKLGREECAESFDVAAFVRSSDESKALNRHDEPIVIISASGMATGGRVLHHLEQRAPVRENTILLPGYQAAGTRGASLAKGERSIKMHGHYVQVNAEVVQLGSMSAHADRNELIAWLRGRVPKPKGVILVHGEAEPADSLRRRINEELGVPVHIPQHRARLDLE